MKISIDKIRELRSLTGSGVLSCKDALVKSGGSVKEAVDLLRSKQKIFALNKTNRETRYGAVFSAVSVDYKAGAIVELTCETDFVAKSSFFIDSVKILTEHVLKNQIKTLEELLLSNLHVDTSVESFRLDLVNRFSENINITNMVYVREELGCIGMYTHYRNTIPCISTLVIIDTVKKDLAHDMAVQVAVSNSKYCSYLDIPGSVVEKETEITRSFLCDKYKDKQGDIFDNIVKNSVKKTLSLEVLDEQYFVKDPTVKVKDLLRNEKTNVVAFYMLSVGV